MRRSVTRPSSPRCGHRRRGMARWRPHCGKDRGRWLRRQIARLSVHAGVARRAEQATVGCRDVGGAPAGRSARIEAAGEALGHRVKRTSAADAPCRIPSSSRARPWSGCDGVVERRLELAELCDAVERGWRGGEPLRQRRVLLRDVVAVEAVEEREAIAVARSSGSQASQAGASVNGASASATTTLGRKRRQSPPSSTSRSAPSTSILRKSIAFGAYCSHSARSVVTGMVIACERLPNSLCAARAWSSIVVERPWKSSTR